VSDELQSLAQRTGADELMVTATTHDPSVREHTLELLAKTWPL
jgi:hypothetical protein